MKKKIVTLGKRVGIQSIGCLSRKEQLFKLSSTAMWAWRTPVQTLRVLFEIEGWADIEAMKYEEKYFQEVQGV